MTTVLSSKGAKLMKLCDLEGYKSIDALLRFAKGDVACPGICMTEGCDHTTEVASNVRDGYCAKCGGHSVMSARALARSGGRA